MLLGFFLAASAVQVSEVIFEIMKVNRSHVLFVIQKERFASNVHFLWEDYLCLLLLSLRTTCSE